MENKGEKAFRKVEAEKERVEHFCLEISNIKQKSPENRAF